MITSNVRETRRDPPPTVTVRDPNGHRSVEFEGLCASTTAAEIRARAIAALRLPGDVQWHLRTRKGRLLRESQRLREFAEGEQPQAELTMQPDAALG